MNDGESDWEVDTPSLRTKIGRISRKQILLVGLALAFFIPIAVGLALDIQYNTDNPQRNWFWNYELTGGEIQKSFPDPPPVVSQYPTIEPSFKPFYYYWSPTYSRSLKSVDGGPIRIEAGDNPFADVGQPRTNPYSRMASVEPADTFTFGDVYDNLAWFITDWRPLQWVAERLSFFDPSGSAAAAPRYLTMDDTNCAGTPNPTNVATDVDCWSDTTGEDNNGDASGFTPSGADDVFFDANSGVGTGTMDGVLTFDSLDTTDFPGTFAISTFELDVTGAIVHAAGVITIGVSAALGLDVGSNLTMSGTASIQMGTAAADGDIDGNVNVSSTTAYIDFGSGTWLVGGTWTNASTDAGWDAGTGSILFDSATGGTMIFASFDVAEDEFNDVTFTSSAGDTQTFTMNTRGLRIGGTLLITDAAGLTVLVTSNLPVTAAVMNMDNANARLTAGASVITVSGNWASAAGDFQEGSSNVLLTGTGDVDAETFNNLTSSGGTRSATGALIVSGNMGATGGVFAKGTQTLAVTGNFTVGGGAGFTSTSGDVTVGGNVSISAAAGYIDFGSEAWTVSGTWTNSSTSASWDAGTGSMLFDSAASGTMTFAAFTISENEFDDVTFDAAGGAAVVFTMSTNGLIVGGTLTITDTGGGGTTQLDTSAGDLQVDALDLVLAGTGSFNSRASTVNIVEVAGAGTITIAAASFITNSGGTWTSDGAWANSSVSGSWDFDANILFTATADVTMDWANLVSEFDGNVTFTSGAGGAQIFTSGSFALNVGGTLTISDGVGSTTLNTDAVNDYDITAAALVLDGNGILLTNGSTVDINGTVGIDSGGSYITNDADGAWSVSGNWTSASTDGTWAFAAPITFDGAGASQAVGGAGTNNVFADVVLEGTDKAFTADFETDSLSSIDAAKTMTITAAVTWTVGAAEAVAGAGGNVLTIVSGTPGTQWVWTSAGAVTITFVDVSDAAADAVGAATAADFDATAASNTDSENNTYVEFAGSPVTEYIGARWYEDPDSYYWAGAVDGLTALTQWDVTTDVGYFGTTVDTLTDPVGGAATNATATVCSSAAGATIVFTIGGLRPGAGFVLTRDTLEVATALADVTGVWTETVVAGWNTTCATNALILGVVGTAGGGGGSRFVVDYLWVVIGGSIGASVSFQDNSYSTQEMVSWEWDFGDGSTGSGQTIIHLFRESGTYKVKLTVTDINGSSDSEIKQLTLEGLQTRTILNWWADNAWVVVIALFVIALLTKRKKIAWATISIFTSWGILRFIPGLLDYLTLAFGFLAGIPVPPSIPVPAWPF